MEIAHALAKSLTSMQDPSTDERAPAMPMQWVERLFERLSAILGAKMADVVGGAAIDDIKAEWGQALATFRVDEIRRGLDATRTRKFPPNLPEFLHLCRPALDAEVAWIEAETGMAAVARRELFAWSHPAVYWAGREMQFELRSSTFAQQRKRWERLMALEWAKGAWLQPPDPRQRALEAPQQQEMPGGAASIASARKRLAQFRKSVTGFESMQAEQLAAAEMQALLDPRTELPESTQGAAA